jgi:hypothetical protein
MAISGTLNSTDYDGRYIQFKWTASQNIKENKSEITWTLKGAGDATYGWYKAGNFKITIDGATILSSSEDTRIKLENGTVVASGVKTLTHNSDGTRSFTVKIQAGIYTYAVNCRGEKTFTLDPIPVASRVDVSDTSVDMGTIVTFTITRSSSSLTHKLTYSFEGESGSIGSDIETFKMWRVPLSLASRIPDKTSGTCVITCITYDGETELGRTTTNMTIRVPSSTRPTVDISVSEAVQEVADTFGVYVKGLSRLAITATGAGAYGSTVTSHTITFNGVTYAGNSIETDVLTSSGDITIQATATDSRGYSSRKIVTVAVENYNKPYITKFEVVRCDADGTENEEGENAKIVIDGGVTNLTGNSAVYTLKYKNSDEAYYTSQTLPDKDLAISKTIIVKNVDVDLSHDFGITITDEFSQTDASATLGTAFTLMDYHASGKGIAIGKVSEKERVLEVNLETDFNEPVNINEPININGPINFNSSPWIKVDPTSFHSAVTNYTTRGVEYRKIGPQVYIQGRVVLGSTYDGSTITMFTLPEECYPRVLRYHYVPSKNYGIGRMYVSTAGEVKLEWIRKLADGTAITGAVDWLDVSLDYFID